MTRISPVSGARTEWNRCFHPASKATSTWRWAPRYCSPVPPDDVRSHVEALSANAALDYFVGSFAWGDLNHEEAMASLGLFVDGVLRPLLD